MFTDSVTIWHLLAFFFPVLRQRLTVRPHAAGGYPLY